METVSILIAAYNAESFIHRAIESVLKQSVLPCEIIIVNDCSTDNTKSVVEKIGVKSCLIKVIDMPINGGPAKARNAGIAAASGTWIAVLDADDALESNYIETILKASGEFEADILASNFWWFDALKHENGNLGLEQESQQIWVNKYEFVSGARPFNDEADYGLLKPVFRTEFLRHNMLAYPESLRHGEDFMMMAESLLCGARFLVINEPLYLYTVRSSGMSKTQVAYKKMARFTLTLLNHKAVKNDQRMVKLIELRALSLRKFDAWIKFNNDLIERNIVNLVLRSLTDHHFATYMLSHVKKRTQQILHDRGLR